MLLAWPSRSPAAQAVSPGLSIHPRADWAGDDRPPRGAISSEDVRFLLVHHTVGPTNYQQDSVPGQIRSMYDFHTGPEKGWPDVAYNFLIDRFGGVWEAREGALAGAVSGDATGGNQGYSQLVSLMGDFSTQLPTEMALASLRSTLAWLADRHGVDTTPGATATFESRGSNKHGSGATVTTPTINGHRSMSQTSCPGDALFAYVTGDLMADVSSLRTGAPVPSTTSTTTTTTTAPESTTTESTTEGASTETTDPTTTQTSSTEPPTTAPSVSNHSDQSSVSSPGTDADTVSAVAARQPNPNARTSAGDGLSATEGIGLAAAATLAAFGGLVALRKREVEDSP